MDETPAWIDEDGPAGEAARAALRGRLRWMSRQFSSAGTHLGVATSTAPSSPPTERQSRRTIPPCPWRRPGRACGHPTPSWAPQTVRALFERPLVLVRPDGHVAWRGGESPNDPAALADLVRGA